MKKRYNNYKIFAFPEKIKSFQEKKITAPINVRIKPTNICCHNCNFCIYRKKRLHREMNIKNSIPFDRFLSIIKELSIAGVKAIMLSGGGEPLMYEGIELIAEKILKENIKISLITNGQMLYGKKAKAFSKASWIRVSCNYSDEKQFAESRLVDKSLYWKIIDNIKSFTDKYPEVDLGVNCIVTKENANHLAEIARQWKNIGAKNIRFFPVENDNFREYHSSIYGMVNKSINESRIYEDDFFNIINRYDISDQTCREPICLVAQTIPVIGADLNIYACHSLAYDNHGIIGSIKNISFNDFWKLDETKKRLMSFNPQKECSHLPCGNKNQILLYNDIASADKENCFL